MRRTVMLTLALAAAGCGEPPLTFVLESQAAWVQSSDAENRLRATAARASRFWGAQGIEDLNGWVVVVRDGVIDCGGSAQVGCTEFRPPRRMVLSAVAGDGWHPTCAEATLLAHEVGHAILWTADHDDPRWTLLPAWQQADVAAHPDCL